MAHETRSNSGNRRGVRPQLVQLIDTWMGGLRKVFDPYRPELDYMRGPGPKWAQKQRAMAPARVRAR